MIRSWFMTLIQKRGLLMIGKSYHFHHIAPGDTVKEHAFVRKLSAQSRYFRFHGSIKELNKKELEMFTNPDPLNTEALIILYKGEINEEEIAVARFIIDADGKSCEFAIVVADEWQKRGIGAKLLASLIKHAQSRGIKRIYGSVRIFDGKISRFLIAVSGNIDNHKDYWKCGNESCV